MKKKYIVRLTDEERAICETTIKDEKGKSEKLRRATILLRSDTNGQGWDEQPVQLIGETRVPIPATKEHPERVDYEYERKGTASIFMFAEPLSGFRQATARPRRTKDDWAQEVAQLLDTRYAGVEQITLVCDNLNTHTKGAFYEAFPPDKARDYVRRINFVYTPKHGSWLNVAECELSCLTSHA